MSSETAPKTPFDVTDPGLLRVLTQLNQTLERDASVGETINRLRTGLQVNRVLLYYFYKEWEGRVAFESFSDERYSILGSTGPDECFNDEYAELYQAGRIRSISDIDIEPIADCHKDFLKGLQVRANLVAPILTESRLWGLLVAHHCQAPKYWSEVEVQATVDSANALAKLPSIAQH
ncbi:MAG: GAF domain-containing protein [Synechococcus sp.]